MAVKTGVATQALGFVEEKLRRVFRLAGPINASLDPECKPVIVVDDLRDPGHAFYQGRSWAVTQGQLGIAAGTKVGGFQFNDDVILEGFDIRCANGPAGSLLQVFIVTPVEQTTTPPVGALATRLATWRDNKTVGTLLAADYDQPPVVASGGWAAIVGTQAGNGNQIWIGGSAGAPQPGFVPVKLFMPRGSAIYLQELNYVDLSFSVYGRIFPQ